MTSAYILYSQINSLNPFALIAGTDYTLEFNMFESDGVTPEDIGGATITWFLSPYGQTFSVSEIEGVITGLNTFEVFVPATETINFSGKYIQQIKLDSFFGQTFRPAQGVVLIVPSIT